jgi:glutamate/aspartate transport system substrate-binding protein
MVRTILAVVAATAAVFGIALAAEPSGADGDGGLDSVLANIKKTHTVRIGYREASLPFSFLDRSGRPIGYAIELCGAIVDEIGRAVDEPAKEGDVVAIPGLKIEYVRVTSDDRIALMLAHKIDLECGSTTANAERAKLVAFSPLTFVAGTRLLVARASGIGSVTDLKGRTVVVTRGTTNEKAMQTASAKLDLQLKIVTAADHEESYRMLAEKQVDAFATDDILLYGLIAKHKAEAQLHVVGDLLSYEPYGIMYPRDVPALKTIVERAFRGLAAGRDLVPMYNRWFRARLPTGERLNIPMSSELADSFDALGSAISAGD